MKRSRTALVVLGIGLVLGACSNKGTDPEDPTGKTPKFVTAWPILSSEQDTCDGQPVAITSDASGNVFVLDVRGAAGQMVLQHRADGTWVRSSGAYSYPSAMTVRGGSLCVLDSKAVVEYSTEGTFLSAKEHHIPESCWWNNWSKGIGEGYLEYSDKQMGSDALSSSRVRWTIFSVNCSAPEAVAEWDTVGSWYDQEISPLWSVHTTPNAHFLICARMDNVFAYDNRWYIRDLLDADHYPDMEALSLPWGLGAIAVGPKTMVQAWGQSVWQWPVYVVKGDEVLKYFVSWTPKYLDQYLPPIYRFYGEADPDWLGTGTENGPLDEPVALACDSLGSLFVLDGCQYEGTPRIQKFSPDGTFLTQFDPCGHVDIGEGRWEHPVGMTISPAGEIFVCDDGLDQVLKFK